MSDKPKVKLSGQDGNIYAVIGSASRALRRAGQSDKCEEMKAKIKQASDYYVALGIIQEYIDFEDDTEDEDGEDDR